VQVPSSCAAHSRLPSPVVDTITNLDMKGVRGHLCGLLALHRSCLAACILATRWPCHPLVMSPAHAVASLGAHLRPGSFLGLPPAGTWLPQ
jgi:hypothetical protein